MATELESRYIKIYQDYYNATCSYIERIVNDHALAEDLTQETFIKIMTRLKDFDESKKPAPWIFRIAHNTCIDYFRCNKTTFELVDENVCYDKESNQPENIILNKEKSIVIRDVLLKMSQKYRTAILLRDINDLSYKEVASALKLNEATVKTLIRRGRQHFKKAYSKAY